MNTLLIHLLSHASLSDEYVGNTLIHRGQLVLTRDNICRETGLSIQEFRTRMNRLVIAGKVTLNSTNAHTLVTLTDLVDSENQLDIFNEETTNEQPTNNQRITNDPKESLPPIPPIKEKENTRLIDYKNNTHTSYKRNKCLISGVCENFVLRYNREFQNLLKPCTRLTTYRRSIIESVLQSNTAEEIDLFFTQLHLSNFLHGANKSGFVADITFCVEHFSEIVEGKYISRKTQPQPVSIDFFKDEETEVMRKEEDIQERRQQIISIFKHAQRNPGSSDADLVKEWIRTGFIAERNGECVILDLKQIKS